MKIITQRLAKTSQTATDQLLTLALVAEERTRSRYRYVSEEGQEISLQLPRGTVLRDGDILADANGHIVAKVVAKPEPVITVTAHHALDFLRAAYHLGNRHIALEITESYLRFSPDPVLQDMVAQMGLHLVEEVQPFQPETGAYHHHDH
ncbi:MAG: urease accessory protein UreE [Pseudanabaenaceae cyanobacterium bins.39]|nr:urease accessory protein UreE [Pseudanabaenaceae cyanobacterium bins.39]